MKDSDGISEDYEDEMQDSQFDWLANIYTRHGAKERRRPRRTPLLGLDAGFLVRP